MREGCVLLLGSSDGVELVVVDGITWRVPSELMSTTSGVCGPATPSLKPWICHPDGP